MSDQKLVANINVTGQGSLDIFTKESDPENVYIATNNPIEGPDGKSTVDDRYHSKYSAYELYGIMGQLELHLEKQGFAVKRVDARQNFKPEIFQIKNQDEDLELNDFARGVVLHVGKFISQQKMNSKHGR